MSQGSAAPAPAPSASDPPPPIGLRARRPLALAVFLLSAWAVAAPYLDSALGLDVPVRPSVEVVDHVVPGIVSAAAAVALAMAAAVALPATMAIVLAGFWMTATHFPLVLQAVRDEVELAGAVWHSAPGLCLIVLGGACAVAALRAEGPSAVT